MHRVSGLALRAAFVGAFMLAGAAGAKAAPPQSYGVQAPGIQQQPAPPNPPAPLFSIFGLPVGVNAPVSAPYCNCATQIYGGQPMRGGEALIVPAPDRQQ